MNPSSFACVFLICCTARADIIVDPFPNTGHGGSANGHNFSFGSEGAVYEIDSLINVDGMDLNGGGFGTSAFLSLDQLPAGLDFGFVSSLSFDRSDLTLRYQLDNTSQTTFRDLQFFSFVDAEIDFAGNGYQSELASVNGAAGAGSADSRPDSFEVDVPLFNTGDILENLLNGQLDNTNVSAAGNLIDVSMALGFSLGDFAPGDSASIFVLLSEDGAAFPGLNITHTDPGFAGDAFTMSGFASVTRAPAAVPEPGQFAFLLAASLVLLAVIRSRSTIDRSDA